MKSFLSKKPAFLFIVFLFFIEAGHTQQLPFWNEIQAFKTKDSLVPPPKNAILFVGSSSFRVWSDVSKDFPDYKIINRGFGGSTLPDVIRYADQIIVAYHPKQVVIYCGDNDLAASDTVTAQTVLNRFTTLFDIIRKKLPRVPIAFVSIKPSPSRAALMSKMDFSNYLIKTFLSTKANTSFIDVYHLMLDEKGLPRKELFIQDQLHMNKDGYRIWQKAIHPYLLK